MHISKPLTATIVAFLLLASTATAGTIHVETTKDEFGGGGTPKCALREAIQAANENQNFGGCSKGQGPDTVVLRNGTYKLSIAGSAEDENAEGDLDSTQGLKLAGNGRDKTTINGNGNVIRQRILEQVSGNLTVQNLTMRNAKAYDGDYYGAAIGNEAITAEGTTLAVKNVSLEDNFSYYSGGGIAAHYGNMKILNSRIVDNGADDYAGGVYFHSDGKITIKNSLIAGNQADDGVGGVDVESGDSKTVISRTVIRDNGGQDYGGGLYLEGESARIANSTISGNHNYEFAGGGIQISTVEDPVVIENSTISNNYSGNGGGGIYAGSAVILRNSTVTRNYAYDGEGGGIQAAADGSKLLNATVSRNFSYDGVGGIDTDGHVFEYRNSIIARNHEYGDNGDFEDCDGGSGTSLGRNLIGDDSCGSVGSDLVGTDSDPLDPKLDSLANNGGPTQTLALIGGSPAINKGQGCLPKDQRGKKRTGKCDIGAFER